MPLTREYVFVNAGKLDVGFRGICHNETIYDAFRDQLRHRMSEQVLNLNGGSLVVVQTVFRGISIKDIG